MAVGTTTRGIGYLKESRKPKTGRWRRHSPANRLGDNLLGQQHQPRLEHPKAPLKAGNRHGHHRPERRKEHLKAARPKEHPKAARPKVHPKAVKEKKAVPELAGVTGINGRVNMPASGNRTQPPKRQQRIIGCVG